MYCRMNRVECRYADMNGYCVSTACHNMNLVGNIIPKERPENISNSSIWVKPQGDWHTGTPTEEGWYLLECNIGNSDGTYYATDYWNNEVGYWTVNRVIRWQKIEED